MFKKILVANRGEIALRIIRACKEMGIPCAAVYSEADENSPHRRLAGESVCVGSPISAKSYLNADAILDAAKKTGADAVHPGYGYLAEKAEFARACADAGLEFIGPGPDILALAGDKIACKKVMAEAGVPVTPGPPEGVSDVREAARAAREIGYPALIKSSGGGGGRGIRICRDEAALQDEFPIARAEAGAAFGDDRVYIEKLIEKPRHIEFQVLADRFGHIVHLGERECTIQRRYQKLIEESPSPALTPDLREKMGEAAVRAAAAVDYFNAGTVEFMLAPDGRFYFIEINARIQVEHPVTEIVTGMDLVKEQIRLSSGGRLSFSSKDVPIRGWAMECRINAEDPDRGFLPSPGVIEKCRIPGGPGVRVDTHIHQGYEPPPFYDSLMAKLIAFGPGRKDAIAVMRRALDEFQISPIKTTIPLHRRIMDDPSFIQGDMDTGFMERFSPGEEEDD
ncbi:acetyl-CoA carboxylase, biotin carboxylase subunit [Candidatus Desulfarcum epimagneticum]|uniref:Biotin carboxylase n=1 Tax=uncultured Desulfobacteraceae bacterium TaxID=218296 RepID=A0A484HHK7_9BACT|nr:acetyl-CoA carboxylase, biotin carboxylase subunit [uncultured Desulfobacteraceae bacterium]